MGLLNRNKSAPGILLGGARMAFFTDHKRPPRISVPLDWDSRDPDGDDPVERVAVGVGYSADVPRPRADLFLVLSYITKVGTNLGGAAEDLLWPSLGEPQGGYGEVGPLGFVDLEVIEPSNAPSAPTRTFAVEHRTADRWFVQAPYEGKRGREDYYAPMSVWGLIRKVRADLGDDAGSLDQALRYLHGYYLLHADVLAKAGPALFALPEALIDEVLGPAASAG